MNFTPIEDAYKIHHVDPNTYSGSLIFSPVCIYCKHNASTALMTNDGGSFRRCDRCRKNFKAIVLNQAISNFRQSTKHLHGTN